MTSIKSVLLEQGCRFSDRCGPSGHVPVTNKKRSIPQRNKDLSYFSLRIICHRHLEVSDELSVVHATAKPLIFCSML